MLHYANLLNKIFRIWFQLDEKTRFILVGGYNTVFAYILFFLFTLALKNHLHYQIILLLTHLISVLNSFFTLRYFVFNSQGKIWPEYLRVNIVYGGYFICNALLLYILKEGLEINILLAQFICVCVLTAATYLAHKHFSFTHDQKTS